MRRWWWRVEGCSVACLSQMPYLWRHRSCLDANGTGSLLYNWYPTPDYETLFDEESFDVAPASDLTYSVNVQNGVCYCAKGDVFVDKYESANAGEDIYICTDPEKPVKIGGLSSYAGATLIVWFADEGAPSLSSNYVAQPNLDVSDLEAGEYTYSVTVFYPGFCQYSDEIVVHVVACCTSEVEGAIVFNPYDEDYDAGENYLTVTHLITQIAPGTYDNSKHPANHVPNYPKLFFLRLPSRQQLFDSVDGV